jgi:hypothetical protein
MQSLKTTFSRPESSDRSEDFALDADSRFGRNLEVGAHGPINEFSEHVVVVEDFIITMPPGPLKNSQRGNMVEDTCGHLNYNKAQYTVRCPTGETGEGCCFYYCSTVCVCLLLQDLVQRCLYLLQSCSRGGGGGTMEDICVLRETRVVVFITAVPNTKLRAWGEEDSNPKPRPKPKPSSADVAERCVASIGVRKRKRLGCVYYCRT